jgi:hypothetical protein
MTNEQIEEIKRAKQHIANLALQMDEAYDSLVEKLNMQSNQKAQDWLFDYVYNSPDTQEELNYHITKIDDNI